MAEGFFSHADSSLKAKGFIFCIVCKTITLIVKLQYD